MNEDIYADKDTLDKLDKIIFIASKVKIQLKMGESKIIECPECGGEMYTFRSGYNGHLRMNCRNCGLAMME